MNPKVIVLLAGTNNVGSGGDGGGCYAGPGGGGAAMQAKAPNAVVVLTGIFPRNDKMAAMATIDEINANLAKMADGKRVRYLNVNDRLADRDGKLFEGMMADQAASDGEGVSGVGGWAAADL